MLIKALDNEAVWVTIKERFIGWLVPIYHMFPPDSDGVLCDHWEFREILNCKTLFSVTHVQSISRKLLFLNCTAHVCVEKWN